MTQTRVSNIKFIESPTNPLIKEAMALRDAKARKESGRFLVEGAREIEKALSAHYDLQQLFSCEDLLSERSRRLLEGQKPRINISQKVFAKLAIREGSDGVLAVFKQKKHTLANLQIRESCKLIVLENTEKPGNLGAALRVADGSGVTAVVALEQSVDLYNPNTLRASIGCAFAVPFARCTNEEFLKFSHEHRITSYAAILDESSRNYTDVKFSERSAIILGSEDSGVSEFWRKHADQKIKIPMLGTNDSLNVSVAGAVISYEILRQKQNQ